MGKWLATAVHHIKIETTTNYQFEAYSQFRITNKPNMHGFGLWEETQVPGGNPHRQMENIRISQ